MGALFRSIKKTGPERAKVSRGSLRRAAVALLFALLLLVLPGISAIYAYFTDRAVSGRFVFEVTKTAQRATAGAGVVFTDSPDGAAGLQNFSGLHSGSGEESTAPAPPDTLRARIWLYGDYDTGDIYIPSVYLSYGGHSTPALYGEMSGGFLLADFCRKTVASWFTGDAAKETVLTVGGEGYENGLWRFTFTGTAVLDAGALSLLAAPPVETDGEEKDFTQDRPVPPGEPPAGTPGAACAEGQAGSESPVTCDTETAEPEAETVSPTHGTGESAEKAEDGKGETMQ